MSKLLIKISLGIFCGLAMAEDITYQSGNAYTLLTDGKRIPAIVVYTTDGNGTITPVAAGGTSNGALTNTQLRLSPVDVTGTFWQATQPVSASSLPLPSGASTETTLSAVNTKLPSLMSAAPGSDTGQSAIPVRVVSQLGSAGGGGGGLTNTELRASAVPVSGTFFQATQPVSASALPLPSGAATSAAQTTGNSSLSSVDTKLVQLTLIGDRLKVDIPAGGSGLTDTELRATPVPVSGTFYPATQPVSGTVTANAGTGTMAVSGPLTDTQIRATALPVSGTFFQATQPVSLASMPSTPVTGTFWQATQPVSGPLTDTQIRATALPVSGTVTANAGTGTMAVSLATAPTTPVTGTFWQATQPVSGTVTANATLAAETTKVIGTINVAASQSITANPPAITKGTQGTTGFTTQDIKDAGRVHIRLRAVATAAGTTGTETLFTLTRSADNAATSTGTSFTVTSGKRFRITSFTVATRGHATATIQSTTFNLRVNAAGACLVGSTPIIYSVRSATAAVASDWDRLSVMIPEGDEIVGDGTAAFCLSAAATYVTNAPTWDVFITGFEY